MRTQQDFIRYQFYHFLAGRISNKLPPFKNKPVKNKGHYFSVIIIVIGKVVPGVKYKELRIVVTYFRGMM